MKEPRKAREKRIRKRPSERPSGRPKTLQASAKRAPDPVVKLIRGLVAVIVEILKLGREMLVIPAQLWMTAAEAAGAVTLRGWRLLRPVLVAALRLLAAAERRAERLVTPRRAVAAVAIAALIVLAASQWADYREISVGTGAYGGVETVAPAPDIAAQRAGDAHAWVMLPLAVAGLLAVAAVMTGRARAARWLIGIGAVAIVISLVVDLPKGLDEGQAAVAYEGAKASLLEGFWLQIVCGATLIWCGALLTLQARPEREPARAARKRARGLIKRLRFSRPAARSSA